MKIGLGSDHNAFEMKRELLAYIKEKGYEVKDYGCFSSDEVDYPNIAFHVANGVLEEEVDRGILCCGTGIGMAVAANKVPGIRAAQVHDTYSAERAQLSNNAQIITMGSKVIGIDVAKKLSTNICLLLLKEEIQVEKLSRLWKRNLNTLNKKGEQA